MTIDIPGTFDVTGAGSISRATVANRFLALANLGGRQRGTPVTVANVLSGLNDKKTKTAEIGNPLVEFFKKLGKNLDGVKKEIEKWLNGLGNTERDDFLGKVSSLAEDKEFARIRRAGTGVVYLSPGLTLKKGTDDKFVVPTVDDALKAKGIKEIKPAKEGVAISVKLRGDAKAGNKETIKLDCVDASGVDKKVTVEFEITQKSKSTGSGEPRKTNNSANESTQYASESNTSASASIPPGRAKKGYKFEITLEPGVRLSQGVVGTKPKELEGYVKILKQAGQDGKTVYCELAKDLDKDELSGTFPVRVDAGKKKGKKVTQAADFTLTLRKEEGAKSTQAQADQKAQEKKSVVWHVIGAAVAAVAGIGAFFVEGPAAKIFGVIGLGVAAVLAYLSSGFGLVGSSEPAKK